MRVLIINTSERIGGAAIAASRLLQALTKHSDVKTSMLVRDRQTNNLSVHAIKPSLLLTIKFIWERLVIFLNNGLKKKKIWSVDIGCAGSDITKHEQFIKADVVHIHWINQSFLSLNDLQKIISSGKKIVITLHDMWHFTSVCHYASDCTNYEAGCHQCALLNDSLVKSVFKKKQEIYKDADIVFVGCSNWITELARRSALTKGKRIVQIHNAIDTEIFRPYDKAKARDMFSLPNDKKLILFGCRKISDQYKGFPLFVEACKEMNKAYQDSKDELAIVVVGADSGAIDAAIPYDVYPVRYISSESDMAMLYSSVDAFVTPSLQDNLPNTIAEASACGCPCVGFDVGGIPEMIDHKISGYVAAYKDAKDLAQGIMWTIEDKDRHMFLSREARIKALETYSEASVSARYTAIYNS